LPHFSTLVVSHLGQARAERARGSRTTACRFDLDVNMPDVSHIEIRNPMSGAAN
jgi:hypothetical protein